MIAYLNRGRKFSVSIDLSISNGQQFAYFRGYKIYIIIFTTSPYPPYLLKVSLHHSYRTYHITVTVTIYHRRPPNLSVFYYFLVIILLYFVLYYIIFNSLCCRQTSVPISTWNYYFNSRPSIRLSLINMHCLYYDLPVPIPILLPIQFIQLKFYLHGPSYLGYYSK